MVNDIAVQEFVKAIKEEPQDTNKTYNATVSKVDGEGVVWVNIHGSDKETPTSSTSTEVKRGDSVTVNWRNNKLYIGGNYSNPSAGIGTVAPSVNYVNDLIDKDISVASINAATGYIGDLTADNITAENIKATNGYIQYLVSDDITAEDISASSGYIKDLQADSITASDISAASGYIKDLEADSITAGDISSASGYIKDLEAENITAENIVADHETVGSLNANYAHITQGVIDNAKIGHADVNGLNANYAHITQGVIDNAKIGYADVNNLNAHYAEINLANVDNAWIDHGAMKKAEVFDGNVFDLSGDKATIKRIDASKINVANLRADNLVVRRINGQPVVGGYTLIDSNSPGYSSKNPKALGWYELVNAQWVLSTDTTVDMTKAYYQEGNEVSLYDQAYIDGLENDLQQQIDGAIETFTGAVVPTLTNYPYTDWYDTSVTPVHDERAKHVGDIYYVVNSASDENGYCYRFAYDNTSHAYSWMLIKDSDVTKALSDISDLQTFESETTSWIDETDEGIETIRKNHTALTGVVNKTVKESVQLWFTKANTTAPNKPTAEVTSTSTSGNAWRKVVPSWNASYPNYYYCWQFKFVDGSFGWSDVVRDIAMGETQGTARDAKNTADAALPASTFTSFESTTFKDVKDNVNEHSVTFTNMTSRLGMNSDGTGANTDVIAKESALETTVDGISTRVGKTETKLIGMYATSSTAEGTAAKVATITPALPSGATWELGTGTIITVKFTNANTAANPTLNVNSKGAKAIKTYANGNLTEAEYKWKAGSTFTFTYNGTNWLMQDSSASVRMNSAETGITQNADAIKLEASRRESAVNMLLDSDAKKNESSDYPSTSSNLIEKVNAPGIRYWSNSTHTAITCTLVSISDPPESGIKYAARFVCDGTQTAVNTRAYTFYGGNGNQIPLTLGQTYTISWWARCTSGSGQTQLSVAGKSATAVYTYTPNENLTSTWKRYTYTFTFDALYTTSDYQRIWFYSRFLANTAGTVEICGCKLMAGDAVEAYKTMIEQTADNVLIKATRTGATEAEKSAGGTSAAGLINVSPDSVKISANHVEINGTAIFNAIKTKTDAAYDAKGSASAAESNAKDYADGAVADKADKSNAVARTQRIYYRKTSSGAPSANKTWLATSGTGYGNWSLKVPQMTSGTTKYPYLYTAVQTQTVAQMAAGNACSCSAVLLDDTTTVIDGGTIITGTIDTNRLNADTIKSNIVQTTDLNASKITSGTLDASVVTVDNLNASNIKSGTLDASVVTVDNLNASNIKSGTLDASVVTVDNLNASNIKSGILDASVVTVDNLNASNIKSGTLSAARIAANSITANKIAVKDWTDYVQLNPYTASTYGFTKIDDSSNSSAPWYQMNTLARDTFISDWYDCQGDESFRVSMAISSSVQGATTSTGTTRSYLKVGMLINYQDADGVNKWSIWNPVTSSSAATESYNTTVLKINGAVRFRIGVHIEGYASSIGFTGTYKLRKFSCFKMANANLIVDGSITADKISIGAIEEYENLLLDSDAPTLTKVKASCDRYWSDSSNNKIVCSNFSLTDAPEQGLKYGRRFVYDGSVATDNYLRAYAFYNTSDNAIPLVPNQTYTATWWARCTSGSGRTQFCYSKGDGASGAVSGTIYTLTSYWKKYTHSFTFGSALNTNYNRIWFRALFPTSTAGTVEICGCKLTVGADAESYITRIDNNGIRIHPSSTENNSVVINSDGMEVFRGGTEPTNSVAFYGDTSRIGKVANSQSRINISGTNIDFISRDSSGTDSTLRMSRTDNSFYIGDTNGNVRLNLWDSTIDPGYSLGSSVHSNDSCSCSISGTAYRARITGIYNASIWKGLEYRITTNELTSEATLTFEKRSGTPERAIFMEDSQYNPQPRKVLSYDDSNNCILGQGQWAVNTSGYNTYVEGYETNIWGRNKIATNMAITQGSDKRLKKDIKDLEDVRDFVMDLKPVEFKYEFASDKARHLGFIAQDVEKSMNTYGLSSDKYGLITEITGTDNIQYKGLNYTEFIPICIKMIQEQQQEIDALKEALNEVLGN